MGWFDNLQKRWGVSAQQVVIILVVFALTGTTIALLKKPVVEFITGGEKSVVFSVVYFILIFPIYILFLLFYGFLFGQYGFFKAFALKTLNRFKKKRN